MVVWGRAGDGPTIAQVGEFGLIDRLCRQFDVRTAPGSGVTVGAGDDTCAFAPTPGRALLATCDSLVEGRHFLPELCSPTDVGHRAAAVNLSDVGAMGGLPRVALVSLGLHPETRVTAVEALYRGLMAEFTPLGVTIAGGNCTSVTGACFVDVTLLGEVEAGEEVRRSGARPGDVVLLTGHPGLGAAGLAALQGLELADGLPALCAAYRRPSHRAREGRALGLSGRIHAMIDVSDGLLGDLGHLCRSSGVGAIVEVDRLPRHPELLVAAERLGHDPVDWLLGPSDDYELLFACAPGNVDSVVNLLGESAGLPVAQVGRVVNEPGVWLSVEGERRLASGGWDHFRDDS